MSSRRVKLTVVAFITTMVQHDPATATSATPPETTTAPAAVTTPPVANTAAVATTPPVANTTAVGTTPLAANTAAIGTTPPVANTTAVGTTPQNGTARRANAVTPEQAALVTGQVIKNLVGTTKEAVQRIGKGMQQLNADLNKITIVKRRDGALRTMDTGTLAKATRTLEEGAKKPPLEGTAQVPDGTRVAWKNELRHPR